MEGEEEREESKGGGAKEIVKAPARAQGGPSGADHGHTAARDSSVYSQRLDLLQQNYRCP